MSIEMRYVRGSPWISRVLTPCCSFIVKIAISISMERVWELQTLAHREDAFCDYFQGRYHMLLAESDIPIPRYWFRSDSLLEA